MVTYLSGIQPTGLPDHGLPHLGNYFGAMRQHIAAQATGGEHFYFLADYHALTTSRDPAGLRGRVRELAASYLALGLDPERAALFRQSDVPEVTELCWMLATVASMGLLERAVSYKDKVARGLRPNVGLFLYPVLQAADILAYDADVVPVGGDQSQHVEMAADLARAFNALYGEVFTIPKVALFGVPKVPGLDGEKMSKSYGNDIWVFETGKALKKRVNLVVTDSRPPEMPKDPDELVLVRLLELFLDPAELAELKQRIRGGGPQAPGYGHLKAQLCEAVEETFRTARERRLALLADPAQIDRALESGARRARERATRTRDRALAACGLR